MNRLKELRTCREAGSLLDHRGLPIDKPQKPDRTAALVSLNRLDGMADHGLELLRHTLARIGKVDFVMQAEFGEVGGVAPFRCKCAHGVYGRRLVVVRPSVHALNAKALVDPQQLDRREVQLLLGGSFRNGPVEVLASDEIGQADARDKVEVVLPRVIDLAIGAVLPPEALEWRHDEVEIAFDFTRPLLRHLDGIGNAVGHRQRVLLRAAFGIGIALAPHGNVAHRRNDQNARLVRRFARDVVAHRRR